MSAERTTTDQQAFYDDFYRHSEIDLPIEGLKQEARLSVLERLCDGQVFGRALVVGCGRGEDVTVLQAEMVVAVDLSWVGVRTAQEEYPTSSYVQADGTWLPFTSGTFDVVLCSEVIEHVLDTDRFVGELARVLAPNGRLLLTTPNWISWWGLARKVGEWILRRPITADGQPVDNWFTPRRLRSTLSTYFIIERWRGAWYFPPTGLGMRRVPDQLIAPVFSLLMPLDRLWGRLIPGLGHFHAVAAVRRA